jgi:guanylate kinase
MNNAGLMLILSSPSGAGKTTLARRMIDRFPGTSFSISATTRDPRPGEADGREYYFRTRDAFDAMVENGEMLEHAIVFEHAYGSPRSPVVEAIEKGCDVIFDVDWQGGQQIRESDLAENVVSVFILPPSIAALESRLKSRSQDSDETVRRRMAKARDEISHWDEYDYVLVNDDLEKCTDELATILIAERLRKFRQIDLSDKVAALDAEFDARQ